MCFVFIRPLSCVQLYGLKHARLPCPSPSPRVYSNSFPLNRWCHPTIWSSVVPFTSCLQSFPAQGWFPLGLTGLISLQSKGISRVFSSTTVWKHQFFGALPSLWSNSDTHTRLLEKTTAFTIWTFVSKVMSLLSNTLSRFVITFLPRSNHLLISWLQSLSTESEKAGLKLNILKN